MSNLGVLGAKEAPTCSSRTLLLNPSGAPHYLWQTISRVMAPTTFQYAANTIYIFPLKFLDMCPPPPLKNKLHHLV